MVWKSLTTVLSATLLLSTAFAKGNFQAQGVVSEVRKNDTEVSFRYVGSLSLGYATTTASNPKRQWKIIEVDDANVLVRINHWTEKHEPSKRARVPDTDAVFQKLSALATPMQKVRLSIDNPSLTFSNLGELTAIDGTYAYVVEFPD
jgi:hypothetical protein